ncbi:hypothetical protein [Sphaerisporangium aureirubrum]|uniref:AAA+ ATPase domain-containing protein n=1 Tax=Sphaerisporangium aureirubrum TaxID=1544736 RepID=A0ABW1NS83_9ACTN
MAIINPFGFPDRPRRVNDTPLRPWEKKNDGKWYVDIDDTETAFGEFQETFTRNGAVRQGHLVVATGGTGQGKTSLINRCVAWLQDHAAGDSSLQVFDFSGGSSGLTVAEQEINFYQRLIGRLKRPLRLTEHQVESLLASEVQTGFDTLSELLPDIQGVALVLAPPLTNVAQVEMYAKLIRSDMIFFTEGQDDDIIKSCARRSRSQDNVIRIQAGELKPDDPQLFVQERTSRQIGDEDSFPDIPPEVVTAMMKKVRPEIVSIRKLQLTLHTLCEHVVADNRDMVSLNDIDRWRTIQQELLAT